jgi:hypothetical protein
MMREDWYFSFSYTEILSEISNNKRSFAIATTGDENIVEAADQNS